MKTTQLVMILCSDKMSVKEIGEYFADNFVPKCDFIKLKLFHVLFIHAKTTNSDICAFGFKFIDITP